MKATDAITRGGDMKNKIKNPGMHVSVLIILAAGCFCLAGCDEKGTEVRTCFCSDGTLGLQDCQTDGSSCDQCECTNEYTIWCDPETDLCWQDPQKDAYGKDEHGEYSDIGVSAKEAVQYCEELVLGGYDDWRLPAIAELRSLIAGNRDTQAGGACPVDDNCTFNESWDPACIGGTMFNGPGANGCYLKPELTGTCDKPDIYSAGHYLEVWAQESASDDERWLSSIMPEIGGVCFNHVCSLGDVRCVRDAPASSIECDEFEACTPGSTRECDCAGYEKPSGVRVCNDAGTCWSPCDCTGYTPDPSITPECGNDVCPDSDTLKLTIDIPEGARIPFFRKPHMLIAFFYKVDGWRFPPSRPPDGGTDCNQIIDPGLPPYIMEVPACTYYGEYMLEGDYQLYIHLQMEEKFPPIPVDEDYYWGGGQGPFTFPLDGIAHRGTRRDIDITLESVALSGCRGDTPIECTDGTCVADAAECGTCGDGLPVPDDSQVLTCRYESIFVDDNCADFPASQGWTHTGVEAFCKSQFGADAATVVVTMDDSCLIEKGMAPDSNRCRAVEGGKEWYAYGAPPAVCTGTLGGTDSSGPFCEEY